MTTQQAVLIDVYAQPKAAPSEITTVGVRMPKEMRDEFTTLCESKGCNVSQVIRNFIIRELELSKVASS